MGCSKSSSKKFILISIYIKKIERSQINNLSLHLQELEKEEQTKPKVSRMKKIIKIRAKINREQENNRKD